MSFVVEDGTGKVDASSYASIAQMLNYWSARNVDLSDTEAEALQAALIKATQYVDTRWAGHWKGIIATSGQVLAWPRKGARDADLRLLAPDAVPTKLVQAICEYAKRALTAELVPDPKLDPNIVQQTKTVGPVSTSTTYAGGATVETIKAYPAADMLIAGLVHGVGGTYR